MPGGGKGSSPAGQTTANVQNPTQTAQLPFLTGGALEAAGLPGGAGWNQAANLAVGNPYQYYPGQTLASPNYWLPTGYNSLAAAGANADLTSQQGMSALNYGLGGGYGVGNSPAAPGLSDIAYGGNPFLTQSGSFISGLSDLGNQAAANPYSGQLAEIAAQVGGPNAAIDALTKTAGGAYLNSNTYLDSMFGSASDAVKRAYQTATAPQTASNFSGAGRYGSGAYAGSVGQNEQNLGSSLGNLSANIYGGNYQAERARQDAASQALGALIAQNYGLQGNITNAAGQQYLQGLTLAGENMARGGALDMQALTAQQNALSAMQQGYQTGNSQQLAALALQPSITSSMFLGPQAQIQAGQGLTGLEQQRLQDESARFYGNIEAPWKTNAAYLNQIGQPTTGSSQTTQDYFTNPLANILGAGTGALGLYNGLSGTGMFSGLSGAGMDAGLYNGLAASASPNFGGLGFGAGSVVGGESLLPAAGAAMAWIICTELVRQGRLPRKWWASGAKTFAAYPKIARRGYYVWAIPSVRHLRKRPNSLYSRLLCKVFNWRAEDIAARRGVRGARRLWRGRAVTAALVLPCLLLGAIAKERDWRAVYREGTI